MRREQRIKRNSFRDMIIVIFVVLVCFGLTIYGIVYLTGKIFSGEEKTDNITVATSPVTSDPEEGDVIIYNDTENTTVVIDDPVVNIPGGVRSEKYPNIIEAPAPVDQAPIVPPLAEEMVTAAPKVAPAMPVAPKPTPKPAPKPVTEKPKPTLTQGDFVVQIMAVQSEKAASDEALKYKNICSDVFVVRADLKEKGIWFRIRCGVSATKADAEVIKRKLEAAFNVKPTVIPNK